MRGRYLALTLTLVYTLFVWIISLMKEVFAVVMVIFVNVTILDAVSKRLERVLKSAVLSRVISLIGFFLLLSMVLYILLPAVLKEFGGFYSGMIEVFKEKSWEGYIENPQLREFVTNFMDYLKPKLEEFVNYSITQTTKYVPSVTMQIFFIVLGTIYSLLNVDHIKALSKVLYPERVRRYSDPFLRDLFVNLGRFVLAIFITAVITGVLFFMVFEIFDLPYSVTIGVWAFITNFIPIVGVLFEYVPVFLFSLSLGINGVITMALITLMIHTVAFVTFIHMMKGYTKINPVEMLLFIMILGKIYGLLGIFIAVPVTIYLNIFWKHFVKSYLEGKSW